MNIKESMVTIAEPTMINTREQTYTPKQLNYATVMGGTIFIDNLDCLIRNSKLFNVKIKSNFPLRVVTCYITGKKLSLEHITLDEDIAAPLIIDCVLTGCEIPSAYFRDNYLYDHPAEIGL